MRLPVSRLALSAGFAIVAVAAVAVAQPPADVETEPLHNLFLWMFQIGGFCGLSIMFTGLALFIGSCLVVALARRPAVIASFLVFFSCCRFSLAWLGC